MRNMSARGRIIVYYGSGEGKTMASIGHAIRALGHNRRVVILQFMKGRPTTGEYQFLSRLRDSNRNLEIYLTGAPVFMSDEETRRMHLEKAKEGLALARRILERTEIDLLVLDEILYAVNYRLLEEAEVIELLNMRGDTSIVLSGRGYCPGIIEMADIVTRMEKVKHYWESTHITSPMIEY